MYSFYAQHSVLGFLLHDGWSTALLAKSKGSAESAREVDDVQLFSLAELFSWISKCEEYLDCFKTKAMSELTGWKFD